MTPHRVSRCRDKLIEVARRKEMITYRDLAEYLGIPTVGPWRGMLNEIYNEEMAAGRPDLTLLVVYSGSGYPAFISLGGPAQSVKFDPANPAHRQAWAAELSKIYQTWA